jgi:Protein of unknown function (DUF4235)
VDGRKLLVAKPIGMAAGAVGGMAFKSAWRRVDAGREVPGAQDEGRSWRAVLLAAALQGAVFAVIHAVVERATKPHPAEPEAAGAPQARQPEKARKAKKARPRKRG